MCNYSNQHGVTICEMSSLDPALTKNRDHKFGSENTTVRNPIEHLAKKRRDYFNVQQTISFSNKSLVPGLSFS